MAFRTWIEFVKERQQTLQVLQLVQSHWVRSFQLLQPGCVPRSPSPPWQAMIQCYTISSAANMAVTPMPISQRISLCWCI